MMGAFDDLIPQAAGENPFADLEPGAKLRGDKPADGGFAASAKQSAGSLILGAGQFGADFFPGVSQDNALKRYGQEVIDANPTAVHSLADIADQPLTAAKEATGNAAGSMAGIVGSRLLGQGITAAAPLTGPAAPVVAAVGQGISLLGPYAAAALPSFGSIREAQKSDAPEDKAIAALGAGTVGLVENRFGPQEWALSAMTKAGRDQLAEKFAAKTLTGSIAKGVGTGAAVEGAEELVQNPIEQLASYQDPRTPENIADTAFGATMGAIGGGVVGGPMAGLSHRPQPVTVPRQDGTGSVTLDPANGVISSAAAELVSRTQTTDDLFGDLAPAAPIASALDPLVGVPETGDPFADLVSVDQAASTGPLQEFASQVEAVDLSEAQRLVQQSRDAGSDHLAVIEHPAGGGFIAAPREWLNADQVQATRAPQPSNVLLKPEQISIPNGTAPRGWEGFQSGDRVTTKAGTTGTLHFDDTRTVAYVTPDKLNGGAINPDAGKTTAKAKGAFSVTPAEVGKSVDHAASQANTAPSEAQIAAGNYQKGHIKVGSLDIAIENPVGSTRTGPGWQTTMQDHYGYMKRTEGADGDQVDVYVKSGTPTDHTGQVFVIDQYDLATGKFDEHKAMVGYRFQGAAIKAYDAHFGDGSGPKRRQGVVRMTAEQFKDWAKNGDTSKPAIFTTSPSSNATIQNDRNNNDQIRYAQSDENSNQGSGTEQGRYRDVPENGAGVSVDPRSRQIPLARYGQARQGAVSVVGVHFSGAERQALSSAYYGTGIKGAEAVRLQSLPVEYRYRTYFYVNEGQGVFPESGVGSHAHEVELVNLYDARQDSLDLAKNHRGDFNAFEMAVVAAGFDGYYVPEGFGRQGVAALLGQHTVPVTHKGTGYHGQDAQRPQHAPAETDADRIAKNRTLPMGQMSGAEWKRMVQGVDLSHLDDQKMYFKDQIARRFNQPGRTKKATSLDREIYGLAAVGSSSTRILSAIAEASGDSYRRELARLLLAKGVTPAVTVSAGDGQHAAAYDPRGNAMSLFTEADAERHFLHEAVHAATLKALERKSISAGQMKALYKHVVEQLGTDAHYGLHNLDEFVAEVMTNARFQAELRRLPAAPGSTLASSWHWFVRTVRQLLGLDAKHDSALSQALQLGVSLMDEVSNQTAVDRPADGAELKALRRAAARLERPEDGITFRVTDDGLAIATGPKGKIVPPRYANFARENGLKFEVRRLPVASGTEAPAMPEVYRESGAKYFGELASDARPIDRTGKTRFNVERLAPNGKPSNLNEKQWHQVRTPAFKTWFGDWENDPAKSSRVVDENGEPLVVYHGTNKGGTFTAFKPNERGLIWAASKRATAASYSGSDNAVDLSKSGKQRGVLPVFLNIRKPSEIKADGKSYVDLPVIDGEDFTDWYGMMAKKSGHDGAIIRDVIDDGGEGASEMREVGDNYAVFEAAQLKSATQNAGTFDKSNRDVRFSIAEQDRLTTGDWISHQLANQRSWALGALTRDQLADIYGGRMPEVKEFDRVVQAMDQARNVIAEQADTIIERWRKLPAKTADTLSDIMHSATLEQFDPDIKTRDAVVTPEQSILLKDWAALPEEARQLYRDVRDQYAGTLAKLRNGLSKRAERAGAAGQRIAAEIRLQFDKYLAEGPYFPLARFGDFILIADKGGERIVEAFESSAAREKRARGLRVQGWTTKLTAKKGYSAAKDGPAGEFVGDVLKLVDGLEIEAKEKADLMDSLNQLAISALPDQSYRRHFTHRKGTAGFSQDAMRAFASSMQHVAHHVARVLHGDELTLLLDSMNKRISEATGDVDTTVQQQVANELAKRLDLMMNPNTHPVTALAGQVGFVMSLGGSVASGLTNLSQTPLVTFPFLGAKFGFGQASAALTKASKDYFGGKWDKWSGFVLKDNKALSADERRALQQLEDAGLVNLTQAHDLAGTANTDSSSSAKSFAINRAMKIVGWTFHLPEVFNRQVSALAAYRLARDKGQDHEAGVEVARQALIRSHFDYSGSNRSRWMAGNFTRVVTMFKQYSQNMTYLLWRNAYQSLKGESPEVKREARRMLLGLASMHFAAAGALGMPLGVFGVSPLLGLLAMGMGSEDEPWDWQVEFRNMLADVFGKAGGEAIAHGPLRALTGVDFASRVGLGDLWVRAPQADKEGRDAVEAWMLTLLGPVAGYAGNIGTAAKAFDEGKVGRGLEAMLPKFIAAPIRAARYATDGVKSWSGDDLGVPLDGGDIFATAIGFQPAQLAEMYEGRAAIKGREGKLTARREEISNMFNAAAMAGDSEMQAEAMGAAMRFSQANPSIALTADSLRRSLQAKVRNQTMIKDGVYLSKKRQDLRAEGRFAVTE